MAVIGGETLRFGPSGMVGLRPVGSSATVSKTGIDQAAKSTARATPLAVSTDAVGVAKASSTHKAAAGGRRDDVRGIGTALLMGFVGVLML